MAEAKGKTELEQEGGDGTGEGAWEKPPSEVNA